MALMSTALSTNVSSSAVDASLSKLDASVKNANGAPSQDTVVGPFGVIDFRASGNPVPPATSPSERAEKTASGVEDILDCSPNTEGLLSDPNEFLDWSDLLALDYDEDFSFQDANFPDELLGLESQLRDNGPLLGQLNMPNPQISDASGSSPTTATRPPIDLTSPTVQMLLRHFRDTVVTRMAAVPIGSKSPWEILNTSSAVQTLAEVTYLANDNVKHSKLSNLYGLLAISAHSLSCNPEDSAYPADYWQQLSAQTGAQAKFHLQKSLQKETQGIGKAKYKDQLMMILAMAAYSV